MSFRCTSISCNLVRSCSNCKTHRTITDRSFPAGTNAEAIYVCFFIKISVLHDINKSLIKCTTFKCVWMQINVLPAIQKTIYVTDQTCITHFLADNSIYIINQLITHVLLTDNITYNTM